MNLQRLCSTPSYRHLSVTTKSTLGRQLLASQRAFSSTVQRQENFYQAKIQNMVVRLRTRVIESIEAFGVVDMS